MKWPRRRDRAGAPAADGSDGTPAGDVAADLAMAFSHVAADSSPEALHAVSPSVVLPPEAFAPLEEVEPVPGLTNLPSLPGVFVGRERELRLLVDALATEGPAPVLVVHGLGGVGKSTLAARVAALSVTRGDVVWWIHADTRQAIDAGLADFARALQPALAMLPADTLRARALQWLVSHSGWLLVLDDVTEPDDVRALFARLGTRGRMLVTTRRATGWHGTAAVDLRLAELDQASAVELFLRISATGDDSAAASAGVNTLCDELGRLPLAIAQAAAYCREAYVGAADYLQMLHEYPADMLRSSGEGWDSERTIGRVWQITLDRLAHFSQAVDVLRVLAWYAPTGIPRALMDELGRRPDIIRALTGLAAHSLIVLEDGVIAVHPLVQATARTPDASDPHRNPADIRRAHERAVDLLLASLPDDKSTGRESLAWWRALVPHIDHLDTHTPRGLSTLATAALRARTGEFHHEQGSVRRAVALLEHSVEDLRATVGNDAPDTLAVMNNLAGAYASAGDLTTAVRLYADVHRRQTNILGDDHPSTLVTAANLALAHQSLGDLHAALEAYQEILRKQRRVLGDDHPRTLVTRHNLAAAYAAVGDLQQAFSTYEQLLAAQRRILGPHHIQTLHTENNLASVLASAGDLTGARERYTRLLVEQARILGEVHPDTLATRGNLAYLHLMTGDLDEARESYGRVLDGQTRVLGDDDPRTLATVHNLGVAHLTTDPATAITLLERALIARKRVLGPDHPDTLTSLNSLALGYLSLDDAERALLLLEEAVDARVRILGEQHAETLVAQHGLAEALRRTGQPDRAAVVLAQSLQVAARVLGGDHSVTRSLRAALSRVRGEG
ncbi:tetratricopeptide repeat protein [Streptomyces afghaniensis]|uniref:tetratricopeptide repeat protein n=1 Tax=Streptomyces afghaniensis TaxID=66865 RepID=UPI0037D0C006